jgi:coenzyme F420-reducing hydrogenase beta subunit
MSRWYSAKDIVESGLCTGCGSCVAQSHLPGTQMQFDDYGELKPRGPSGWYHNRSEQFSYTCPFSPIAQNETELAQNLFPGPKQKDVYSGSFQTSFVGYASEDDFRLQGSSGGMVTWVANELLRTGLVDGVAHVVASKAPEKEGNYFHYRISRTETEVREGAKSRYYPIELSHVLKMIEEVPGRYAVVGIPCFIKAVRLLQQNSPLFRERIKYTLGLFCGHMKSARFVESFAWQMKVPVNEIEKVEFRYKDPHRPANWYNAMLTLKDGTIVNKDWWHLADGDWGAGFFMNHACNFCDDVTSETADISFGDAWVEPYSSDGKGTNVVVVRSAEMETVIKEAVLEGRLHLQAVDGKFVEQTQAAGFRQRREGLAYRLTWATKKIKPVKRVPPDAVTATGQRKLIYRLRYYISKWSHRMFHVARMLNAPRIYIRWAAMATAAYFGLAYHKGKIGEMTKRFRQLKQ